MNYRGNSDATELSSPLVSGVRHVEQSLDEDFIRLGRALDERTQVLQGQLNALAVLKRRKQPSNKTIISHGLMLLVVVTSTLVVVRLLFGG